MWIRVILSLGILIFLLQSSTVRVQNTAQNAPIDDKEIVSVLRCEGHGDKEPEDVHTYVLVEEMPLFPYDESKCQGDAKACSDRAFLNYIYSNLVYPDIAREAGVEGMCVVSFVILCNGSIGDIELLSDAGGNCGQAALDVIEKMKEEIVWKPGVSQGKTYNIRYNVPIRFKLDERKVWDIGTSY